MPDSREKKYGQDGGGTGWRVPRVRTKWDAPKSGPNRWRKPRMDDPPDRLLQRPLALGDLAQPITKKKFFAQAVFYP